MQMYFEVSKKSEVEKIKAALLGKDKFNEKLNYLEKKHGAETSHIFHSLNRGLSFSCLWFKGENKEKIDQKLFKITYNVRNNSTGEYGHEARPRKTNKKFYAEFMDGIGDFSYLDLCKVLFDVDRIPFGDLNISYKEVGGAFYISINRDIVLEYRELTASQYKNIAN